MGLRLVFQRPANFFKTWIRAQYAQTIRGKKRGDAVGDFELIGDSYHRWVIDNKDALNLRNSDDFSNLLTGTLPFYVDLYCRIKEAERQLNPVLPHVFYNGTRDLTLQSMVILSAVKTTDTATDVTKKIRSISYFLDYLATVRVLNGKENTYDNIRDLIFDLTKEIRGLDAARLRTALVAKIDGERDWIDSLPRASYDGLKRQDLLHLLARLANYLEESLDVTNRVGFADYVDRTRDSRTFDIEHLLSNDLAKSNADIAKSGGTEFGSVSDFSARRSGIGGLILLPRGRNRSMKDMAYSEKLQRYSGENVLAQTLTESFFLNQPNWAKFEVDSGVTCAALRCADSGGLDRRADLYLQLASRIWSKAQLESMFQ